LRRQLDTLLSSTCNGASLLPLFLHNRNVGQDLLLELKRQKDISPHMLRGVVHSFDDTLELAQEFINLGFYIGLNGCSLKTEANLKVVRALPLSSILLETDCPYCEIKATHAGFKYVKTYFEKNAEKKFVMGTGVKGRNEPNQIIQVAEVISGVKGISVNEVANICYQNSLSLYGFEPPVDI
jgi:TatD DNase family protein